jgi:hypothetical protein
MKRILFEPLLGSGGILLAGFFTIPLAAYLTGASVTFAQGFEMSVMFFVARFAWLLALRFLFSRG